MQALSHTPVRPHTDTPLALWLIRVAYTSAFVLALLLSLDVMGAAAAQLKYQGRIYPGVHLWGVDLSGMTPTEAALALSTAFTYPTSPAFTLRAGGRTWTATPAELGLTFDLSATVNGAYSVGRAGRWPADWIAQFKTWYFGAQVSPVVVYDQSRTLAYLANIAQAIYLSPAEASLVAEGTQVATTPGQIGRQLDVAAAALALREQLMRLGAADVQLAIVETPPLVLDASQQATAAEAILSQPLILVIANPVAGEDPGPWTIDQATLATMLKIQRVQDNPNSARFEVGLDPAALRAFLEPLAPQLERQARNARFIFNDDTRQLEVIEPSLDERTLDIDATIAKINDELVKNNHTIPLVFQSKPPEVTGDMTGEQLGITQLVVAVSTSFAGSTAERVKNIKVASARFHGLLVPPNATFSFDDNLGDVSLDTGFAEALIIYGGRTIRGVGGGVCQVSSTVFRAAYFGGYPIVERNSHAYRVGYYEHNGTYQFPDGRSGTWSDPGLDATVFAPLVDFKFQNDTPYWLLMEVYVNEQTSRLTWKFYSTWDRRQVTVSAADVENIVPHPDPQYEEDPQLPTGQIQQVDYAADGADVTVYRTITRDGAQLNTSERPLSTHYQPWRAVFHYGPGTEGIPTPAPTPEPIATPTP
jgi:vancomycin resistance protein YoaR